MMRLAGRVDRIAAVLPFEREAYQRANVEVDFVGHPILDTPWAEPVAPAVRRSARDRLGIREEARVIGVFPGSRRNEVSRMLSVQLAAVEHARRDSGWGDRLETLVVRAPSIEPARLEPAARAQGARVVESGRDALDVLDVALAKPGTITLELALRERPMVVAARVGRLTAAWVRRSLVARWFSLPNLVADAAIVPECLQEEATPDRIAAHLVSPLGRARAAVE